MHKGLFQTITGRGRAKRILDSSLWIRLESLGTPRANEAARLDSELRAHLGAQLLLYDTVVIPTKDFAIVPILATWCGIDGLNQLLETEAVAFVWMPTQVGYGGNGAGLISVAVDEPDTGWRNLPQAARWGAMPESIEAQVQYSLPALGSLKRSALSSLVLDRSSEAPRVAIVDETYRDIVDNPHLMRFVLQNEPTGTSEVQPNKLSGIAANQVRVLGHEIRDGIDLSIRIAELNTEIAMGASLDDCDLGTSRGANVLLGEKLKRIGATPAQLSGFLSILDLERIPDIRPPIARGEVTLCDVIRLRGRRRARLFRRWLHDMDAREPRELERLYVKAVGKQAASWPSRLLRAFVMAASGLVDPIGGFAVAAGDSLFVDKWLRGYSPKLFLEDLRALPLRDRNE